MDAERMLNSAGLLMTYFFVFVRPWGMQIPQRSFIRGHIGQYEKFFPISRNSYLWFNIIVVGGISLNKVNALTDRSFLQS